MGWNVKRAFTQVQIDFYLGNGTFSLFVQKGTSLWKTMRNKCLFFFFKSTQSIGLRESSPKKMNS